MVKSKTKLPNEVIMFPNKDKEFHEIPKKDDLGHMATHCRVWTLQRWKIFDFSQSYDAGRSSF